jgi:hypothetical protein
MGGAGCEKPTNRLCRDSQDRLMNKSKIGGFMQDRNIQPINVF